jgi:hypothetical protein
MLAHVAGRGGGGGPACASRPGPASALSSAPHAQACHCTQRTQAPPPTRFRRARRREFALGPQARRLLNPKEEQSLARLIEWHRHAAAAAAASPAGAGPEARAALRVAATLARRAQEVLMHFNRG